MNQLSSDSFPHLSANTSPTFDARPKSQLRSSFTPAAKSRYWPQNNLSIETKDKSHQNSLFFSRTTKNQDTSHISNLKSATNTSIRQSESILRTTTAGNDTSHIGFSASGSKRPTKNSQNLRKIVLNSPDTAVSYSFQASAVSLPQTHLLESFQSREVPRIAKFDSLANSNPHYHKFNQSIYILDRSDTEKLSLSKELFYYPDQIEAVENIKRGGSREPEVHLHLLTKIIKENKREELEIPNGRTFYLKFYTYGKICPLAVEIEGGAGQYEVYVSITKDKPGPQQHDAVFKESKFELDFSECDDVKCIFFGIKANQAMRIAILCCFTFRNRIEKKVDPLLPLITSAQAFKRNPKNKRNVYEFFSKDPSRDETSDFEATIVQIKKEKRQKMLQLSKGRNWLNQNKEIAHDYHKIRELQHTASSQKRDFRIQQNKETREILHVETHEKLKQKIFLNGVKGFLTKFGEEEKQNQIRDEKIRKKVILNWFGTLCLFRLASSILEKKRAVFAINILTRIKDSHAVRIQKKIRQYYDKPLIVKEMGTNTLTESKEPEIRTQVMLYEFFNFLALSSKEVKRESAESLIVNFSEDLLLPVDIKSAVDKYIEKVKVVQFKWRQKISLLNAKLQVFFKSWNKFCQLLQDEDNKNKKKKWAHILPMVREIHVRKHAKNFVQSKMREVVKDAMAQALLLKKKQNEAKTLATHLELEDTNHSPPVGRSLERSGTRNSLQGVGSPKSPSAKPNLKSIGKKKTEKFQNPTTLNLVREEDSNQNGKKVLTSIPTHDELRTILHKIAEEIKDDPHHF